MLVCVSSSQSWISGRSISLPKHFIARGVPMAAPGSPVFTEDSDDSGRSASSDVSDATEEPPRWLLQKAAATAGGQVDEDGEFVCRGLVLQRNGTLFAEAFASLPRSQQDRVSCVICREPCSQPVSGELQTGGPCCVAGWLCAACLDRSRGTTHKCPLCKCRITVTNLPFPSVRVDQRLEMLTYDCIVCERKSVGDAHALAKHLIDVHGPAEKAQYDREVKLLHYDLLREEVRKATTRALSKDIRYGALKASFRVQADQHKRREEGMLVKHAEQLSKQEAACTAERERFEHLLREKRTYESEAYARLGEMCFELASKTIQGYGDVADGGKSSSNAECRSRSPRNRVKS